jgi:hypothetical protein
VTVRRKNDTHASPMQTSDEFSVTSSTHSRATAPAPEVSVTLNSVQGDDGAKVELS